MNISNLKNAPKIIIFTISSVVILAIILISNSIFSPKNQVNNSNNSQNSKNNQAVIPNNSKNLMSGQFSDTFNYDGISIKLVESGILTADKQANLPEFCNLSKRCSPKKKDTKDYNPDKDIYYIGLFLTNITSQITVKDLIFDPSGGSTKLINSKNEELTTDKFYTKFNEYCDANPNKSTTRDILPGESRIVNYCFSLPKGNEIKTFKTKLNRPFFTGFDFKEKSKSSELSIELKPNYYNSYDQIQFNDVKKTILGESANLKNLKTTVKEIKIQEGNLIKKVISKSGSINLETLIILELENTSETDIEVDKAYDFVFNHRIGLSEKSYTYNFADKIDATEFKSNLKLTSKQKNYMFLEFGLTDKNINLNDYHLSVIYNSAARKGSFETNNTEFAAFMLR